MRVLYIDTRSPGHNAELHVDFIKFLEDKKFCKIIPYGNNLDSKFSDAIKIDYNNLSKQFDDILVSNRPDLVLTYNKNGSSYEDKRDNVNFYSWAEDILSKVDIPKFHVTTDYCRSGFRQDQADWFKDIGYTASIFRHKVSLNYPSPVDTYWLPFSVDSAKYSGFNKTIFSKKASKVSFLGTAFQEADIYSNRVAAIKILRKKRLLSSSNFSSKLGHHQLILGDGYHRFLERHLFGLTCGGTCNYMTAKYFQIPALKMMLVCSDTDGLEMFPEDTYIKYSKDNMEKLIFDIKYHIRKKNETRDKIMELYRYVVSQHNHKKRAKDLLDIFIKYV